MRDSLGRFPPGHTENADRGRDEAGRYRPEKFDFLLVSDTHLGSKEQQITHLRAAYAEAKNRNCQFAIHAGDLTEFDRMHAGSAYGVFRHGHDEVLDYVVDSYPRSGLTTYIVSGNHDHSGFNYSGTNIVKHICNYRDDFTYLGLAEGILNIFGKQIFIYHGRGGGAYSTRLLNAHKYAQDLRLNPDILIAGHLHQLCEMSKNGCKMILAPCLQGQTLHFKESRLVPWIGWCIVHVTPTCTWCEAGQVDEIKEDYP